MKTEERKKEDCELIDKLSNAFLNSNQVYLNREFINKFKADNDLLPKPKLEFNRWLSSNRFDKWLAFYDDNKNIAYGINDVGEWFKHSLSCEDITEPDNRYATESEILEKLSAMAKKMGYKKGVRVECFNLDYGIVGCSHNVFTLSNNTLCLGGTRIMENGKWANITNIPKIDDSIDKHIEAITKQGYVVTLEKK